MANGRYTGGGIIVDPYACMNDGLVDICWIHDENIMSLFGVAGMLDKAKTKGAIHAYDNQTTFTRGKRLRIDFNGLRGRPVPTAGWGPQLICIDGEGLQFNKFVNFETMPNNIEMLFDPKSYFYEHKSFWARFPSTILAYCFFDKTFFKSLAEIKPGRMNQIFQKKAAN